MGTITEGDETPIKVVDLLAYRRQREYDEFWSDPCWQENQPVVVGDQGNED